LDLFFCWYHPQEEERDKQSAVANLISPRLSDGLAEKVIGAVLALMTRSEIFIAREEASIKQSLMEVIYLSIRMGLDSDGKVASVHKLQEGIAIPVHEKASRAEEPKQVAPDAALEPFGQVC